MSLNWKLYRVVCVLQVIIAVFFLLTSLIRFLTYFSFSSLSGIITFSLTMMLALLGISILNNNYPDVPVEGQQKKNFNRLFLLNFLFLAFLFGFITLEYRELHELAILIHLSLFKLPYHFFIPLIFYTISLIFQLIILYGLYELRKLLYTNFMKKKFEFEREAISH